MMGMGQQMPMRRPPMGPSPMTAGRPNPMAGFQGGGYQGRPPGMQVANAQPPPMGGYQGPSQATPLLQAPMNMGGGGPQGYTPWIGGGVEGNNIGGPQGQYDTPQVAYPQGGMSDAQMHPYAPRNQGFPPMQGPPQMGGGRFPPNQGPPQMGQPRFPPMQGPPDAQLHPFAPRNRPQFPGAMQGGIMGGMGQRQPPWMAGARFV
jgi:hypothetical protein